MIALDRENPAALAERLLGLKPALEEAVKIIRALSARQFKHGMQWNAAKWRCLALSYLCPRRWRLNPFAWRSW
jgi:hypothetical protein